MESNPPPAATRCGNTEFRWGERTYIMGILNLSPDSFSGDGLSGEDDASSEGLRRAITLYDPATQLLPPAPHRDHREDTGRKHEAPHQMNPCPRMLSMMNEMRIKIAMTVITAIAILRRDHR